MLALGILYKFLFFISFCFQALPCELPVMVRIAKEGSGTGDNGCLGALVSGAGVIMLRE